MAWLMEKSIRMEDTPNVHWTQESLDELLKAQAIAVQPYAHLTPDDPNYLDFPSGIPIPEPTKPYELFIKELHGPLPDAVAHTIVNDRIKLAVEAIEPGVHQFIPTVITMPDGTRDADWWAMEACHRIDAVAFEYCTSVYRRERGPGRWHYSIDKDGKEKVVIRKEKVASMAIWYDFRLERYCFSEALGQYFIDNGIRGYALRPEENLMSPLHVEEI